MVIESRESLEQIAREIEWPEEISQYILSLPNDLDEDEKLQTLSSSLYEDFKELMSRYFGEHQDKNVRQLTQYAIQQRWSNEKKVWIGAIEGVIYMQESVERGLEAAAWSSTQLGDYYFSVVVAARFQTEKYTGREHMSLLEKRKYSLAEDITSEYSRLKENSDYGWLREFEGYLNGLIEEALLFEKDPTGVLFVRHITQELRDEPVGKKTADRNLPFTIGKIHGAEKARDLYIARYELLH